MQKTVFILGAGASKEFDASGTMPIGAELADQIQVLMDVELRGRHTGTDGPISLSFMSTGGLEGSHYAAMQRIRDGINSKNSIDDFIEEWKDHEKLQDVALRAIAYRILEAEKQSIIGSISNDGSDAASRLGLLRSSWLGQVVRSINPGVRRRDLADVLSNAVFITFNYDRCIEAYIFQYAVNTLNMDPTAAKEFVGSIPIVHVYGSLGNLNGLSGFGKVDPYWLAQAAAGIRTYTQALEEKHQKTIHEAVNGAEKLLLLGIGYHPQNLQILFGDRWTGGAKIWGTTEGLRPRIQERVQAYFSGPTVAESVRFEPSSASQMIARNADDIF
jgi:hypothetical protein